MCRLTFGASGSTVGATYKRGWHVVPPSSRSCQWGDDRHDEAATTPTTLQCVAERPRWSKNRDGETRHAKSNRAGESAQMQRSASVAFQQPCSFRCGLYDPIRPLLVIGRQDAELERKKTPVKPQARIM